MSRLSKKRIGSEISRCLNEENPHKMVEDLFNAGLMQAFCEDLHDISMLPGRFRLVKGLLKRFRVLNEEIDEEAVLWAGLLSALSLEKSGAILEAMGTPHSRQSRTIAALKSLEEVPAALSQIAIEDNIAIYNLLTGRPLEAFIALMAFALEKQNSRKVLRFIGKLRQIKTTVSGDDLLAAGIPPGPHIRPIFKKLLELKLQGNDLDRKKELEIALQEYKNL
jgi:tRNA nucleotidyltransferase/poly(A) polymerase